MRLTTYSAIIIPAFAAAIAFASFSFAQNADAPKPKKDLSATRLVVFDPFPKGKAAQIVNEQWRKEPNYKAYVEAMDMVPDYMLGLADVNGDGEPEIFARHSDDELGFCDFHGPVCLMHVYAVTKKGVVEIGRMPAADPVTLSGHKTGNVNDIIVLDAKKKTHVYYWDGSAYKPK